MTLPSYQEHEKEFLKAMATRFEFSGKNRIIFEQRFSEKNAESAHKHLAYEWERELLEGTKESDAYRIFRQQLGAICDKLEAEGCKYEGAINGKWKKAKRWLQEDLYQEWIKKRHLITLTCDQLWQQLWEKATHTDKMKPVLVKSVATLDMGGSEIVDDDKPSVPLGSKIYFQLQLEKAGYLLLLEKGTSGKMWCLSPSGGFAPNPHLSAGVVNLPLLGARQSHFKLTGNPGVEEVVAVIAKDKPTLDWLSQVSDRLLELHEGHLKGLLEYLNHSRDCQVIRMAYRVIA